MSDKHTSAAEAEALADMEGFYEKGKGQRLLFFQLFDGSICLKSNEVPTEEGWEVEPIETMNPRTKALKYTYVKRFDKLIVRVGDVNKRQKAFDDGGKVTNWNFTVLAGKKRAILQTVWMDALLQKFLKVAPNIDFSKPILFGAFQKVEKGKKKQLIRIAQGGSGPNSDDWVAVPWYWQKKTDDKGSVILDSKAKGADGTVLPDPIHDEDEDDWDFRPQNKFLAKHFVENTLPGIKKIADELGLSHKMVVDDDDAGKSADFPTHSGPAIPVVTKRPKNPESESVGDAMTPGQASELRKLAKQIGKEVEAVSQKFLEIGFDELSIEGAAYLKYKMEKRIAKAREEDPDAYPEPVEKKKKPKPVVEDDDDDDDEDEAPKKSSKKKSDDDDDDEWDTAPAPKSSQKKKKSKSDDDDDEDWGEHDDNVLRDKDGNVIF